MKNKLRVGTVFSGIGAFEHALDRISVDHDIIFACDNGEIDFGLKYDEVIEKSLSLNTPLENKEFIDDIYSNGTRKKNFVKETYNLNYDIKDGMFFQDIKLMNGKHFTGKIDVLVGGSPCQSFSTVGKKAGLDAATGTLFYEFARMVKETSPEVFIYENVKGLVTHDKGNTWRIIQSIFTDIGYHFKFKIMNAKEYGVPQTRSRIIVVGFKEESLCNRFTFPVEKELKVKVQDILEDNIADGQFIISEDYLMPKKYDPGQFPEYTILTPGVHKYVMSEGTKNFKTKVKIDLEIARTVLASMHNHHRAGVDNYYKVNDDHIRKLSNREALRLMGFSDSFKLGSSKTRNYRQAGNSIVVDKLIGIINKLKEAGFNVIK